MSEKKRGGCASRLWLFLFVSIAGLILYGAMNRKSPAPLPEPSSPTELAQQIIGGVVGADRVISVSVDSSAVIARYEWAGDYDPDFADQKMLEATCALREAGFDGVRYRLIAMVDTVDQFGNEGTDDGLNAILTPEIIEQLNCANDGAGANLEQIAHSYELRRDIVR